MIGQQVTKQDLNIKVGDITSWINEYYNQGLEIKELLDRIGKAGLIGLGFTDPEADILISAMNDLVVSKEQFDTSTFIKQLYGLGIR
jgi:hypothetical protein